MVTAMNTSPLDHPDSNSFGKLLLDAAFPDAIDGTTLSIDLSTIPKEEWRNYDGAMVLPNLAVAKTFDGTMVTVDQADDATDYLERIHDVHPPFHILAHFTTDEEGTRHFAHFYLAYIP